MFNHQMVITDLNAIFIQISMLKTAMYEAMLNAQNADEEMCINKMNDTNKLLKELNLQMQQLKVKMDFLKSQV